MFAKQRGAGNQGRFVAASADDAANPLFRDGDRNPDILNLADSHLK